MNELESLSIAEMKPEDWPAVRLIYLEGIATGNATFETTAPFWEKWDAGHLPACRLVARLDADIVGWAALGPVSSRPVYAGVAENSIYVAERARNRKIGVHLLARLVEASEQAGIWTLQTGIFPENVASIAIHQRCGFRIVGTRERIGVLDGRWRDVTFMERRSKTTGISKT